MKKYENSRHRKETIKNALSWEIICRHYGKPFKHKTNVSCALGSHEDKVPSFRFTSEGKYAGTFKCFSCGEHGDYFSFIAIMEGLDCQRDFLEVLQKADFIAGTHIF